MHMRLAMAVLFAALGLPALAQAAEIFGIWLTEDGGAHIEVYHCIDPALGAVCGRVVWLKEAINPDDSKAGSVEDVHDTENPDPALRGRKLINMDFMRDFKPDPAKPGSYIDGHIYNSQDGDTYSATINLKGDNKLLLRGYVLTPLVGETQTWKRVK